MASPGRESRSGNCLASTLQEVALRRVFAAGDRRLVRHRRLGVSTETPEQIRANRVEQVIGAEIETVDENERRIRSLDLGHRNRTVECNRRARGDRQVLVIQLQDLPPVCGSRGRRVAVDGVDRRLDLVRTGTVAPQALPHDRLALSYEMLIPEAAV